MSDQTREGGRGLSASQYLVSLHLWRSLRKGFGARRIPTSSAGTYRNHFVFGTGRTSDGVPGGSFRVCRPGPRAVTGHLIWFFV